MRGCRQDWPVDRPGSGSHVNWVMRLPLGLVLVGGNDPQCGEGSRVVLAWVGGGETKERQRNLGVSGPLHWTGRTGLTLGVLRRTGGL